MKIGYTVLPAARDVQLDDAHLHTPVRMAAPAPATRKSMQTKLVAAAGITLAAEALRRMQGADAAGMMMICEPGGCYEAPDPFYKPPVQQQPRPLDFSRDRMRPDVFAELNNILNTVAGGMCVPACQMTRFQISDVCNTIAAASAGAGGFAGAALGAVYGAAAAAGVGGASALALCNQKYRSIKEECYLRQCYTVDRGTF